MLKRNKYYLRYLRFYRGLTLYGRKITVSLYWIMSITLLTMGIHYCSSRKHVDPYDWSQIVAQDTLRVLTMYSSTSYFLYRGEEMGYEYELAKAFAESNGLEIKLIVCHNQHELSEKLLNGEGDLIAYPIPVSHQKKDSLLFCGRSYETHQILVQRKDTDQQIITNVTDLLSRKVHVLEGTRYEERLKNLNNELGGGIDIIVDIKDTVTVEDLIEEVALGEIDYTVADSYMAQMSSSFYPNLNISLPISFPQKLGWAVSTTMPELAAKLNEWFATNSTNDEVKIINKRYFERSKEDIFSDEEPEVSVKVTEDTVKKEKVEPKVRLKKAPQPMILDEKNGIISIFDDYFKKSGGDHGVDWQLLAAIGYQESRFDTTAVSWAGARGLMQLMPRTARAMGCRSTRLHLASNSIEAGARLMKSLLQSFNDGIDKEQQIKLALAAYNAGKGHVFDGRALALKNDRNPSIWDENVEVMFLMKQNPEYYNDPVCKFGYVRGKSVQHYVRNVYARYKLYQELTEPK